MLKSFLLLLVCSVFAVAQPIGFGIKGGIPLTDAFDVNNPDRPNRSYQSETRKYILGVTGELRLPAGIGIEVDALYTRLGFDYANFGGLPSTGITNSSTTANSWEFPVLLKYKFGGANAVVGSVRPFVTVGPSFRTINGIKQNLTRVNGSREETEDPEELRETSSVGFALGGGLEIRALFLRLTPEFRYTRWGSAAFRSSDDALKSNQNQAQFLVGFSF